MREAWYVCWVVALAGEARVLLESYGFSRRKDYPFPLYHAEKDRMFLVISGIGKTRSAAATAWLGAQVPPDSLWINFGTAGHHDAVPGSSYWIHKIEDAGDGTRYYPAVLPYWNSESITCYDRVQKEPRGLVDMESSGFFSAALLFTHRELVQLRKVVSDNQEKAAKKLPAAAIRELCMQGQEECKAGMEELRRLAQSQLQDTRALTARLTEWTAALREQYHFTASHQAQLRQLLRRWFIYRQDSPLRYPAQDAPELLKKLRQELART